MMWMEGRKTIGTENHFKGLRPLLKWVWESRGVLGNQELYEGTNTLGGGADGNGLKRLLKLKGFSVFFLIMRMSNIKKLLLMETRLWTMCFSNLASILQQMCHFLSYIREPWGCVTIDNHMGIILVCTNIVITWMQKVVVWRILAIKAFTFIERDTNIS